MNNSYQKIVFCLILSLISLIGILILTLNFAYSDYRYFEEENHIEAGNWTMMKTYVSDEYKYTLLRTKSLQEIKSEISTPMQAARFRDSNFVYVSDLEQYNQKEYAASLQTIYDNKWNGDCEDFSIAIAGLLEDDGYASLTLSLVKKNDYGEIIGHRIYVYQEDAKWGAIGTTKEEDRLPIFYSVEEIAESLGYNLAYKDPIKMV